MQYEELTEEIIRCAYKVHNSLGNGFLESVYEKALSIELNKSEVHFDAQSPINVYYDNPCVGNFIADLIVEGKVIVELKAIRALSVAHEVQLVNYLAATNIPVGLLINFGQSKVQIKRKVFDYRNLILSC
jgi:GxxExxY protein